MSHFNYLGKLDLTDLTERLDQINSTSLEINSKLTQIQEGLPVPESTNVNCSDVIDWLRLTNVLPVDIPGWCNGFLWEIRSSIGTGNNPGPGMCLENPIYKGNWQFSSAVDAWISLDFKAPFLVNKVRMNIRNDPNYDSQNWDAQGSSDNINWANILTGIGLVSEVTLNNVNKYRYFRIINRDTNIPGTWLVRGLQIFGNY